MSYKVLVVREVWHDRVQGRHVVRGEVILDQDEVAKIIAERPHHVIARMATADEAAIIDAAKASGVEAEPEFPFGHVDG